MMIKKIDSSFEKQNKIIHKIKQTFDWEMRQREIITRINVILKVYTD